MTKYLVMRECEYIPTEYLCCDSAFAHKKEFPIFEFPERFLEISCAEISLLLFTSLALLTQSKLPKNQLPTSFDLCYADHLQSSIINSLTAIVDTKNDASINLNSRG